MDIFLPGLLLLHQTMFHHYFHHLNWPTDSQILNILLVEDVVIEISIQVYETR